MNVWIVFSTVIAMYLYYPLIRGILAKDESKRIEQNIASWVLWGLLDVIALAGVILNKGNYALVGTYTLGAVVTVVCIFFSPSKIKWTRVESMCVVLVILCLVGWYYYGPTLAIVSSSVALVLASIPQIVSAWRKPDERSGYVYLGYCVANALSLIGAKNWSIEERYYPSMALGACAITTLCYFRYTRPLNFRVIAKSEVT